MARIRSIHPGIASDEAYMSMSMAAKAAWPLLWTECDDHGAFEWKPIVLKARIFPADAIDFAALLEEYEALGCVLKTELEGKPIGLIRNFCRYQRPKKPSYRHAITEPMLAYVGVKADTPPTTSEPVPNRSPTSAENHPQMKEEGGTTVIQSGEEPTSRRKAPRRISYPPRFEVFWGAYPADDGMSKAEALPEWQKLSSDEQEAAIASMPPFKAWIAKQGPEYRVKHAVNFLKKRRWEGFAAAAAKIQAATEIASTKVYVKYGTEPGDAWEASYRLRGKVPPRDSAGGWWFDTEYPARNVSRQTSDAAA